MIWRGVISFQRYFFHVNIKRSLSVVGDVSQTKLCNYSNLLFTSRHTGGMHEHGVVVRLLLLVTSINRDNGTISSNNTDN